MHFASIFTSVLVTFSFPRSTSPFPLDAFKQTAYSHGMCSRLLKQIHTAGSRRRLHLVASSFSIDRSVSFPSSRILTARFSSALPNFPPMPPAAQNGDVDGISNGEAPPPPEYSPYERWVRRLYMTNMFHPVKLGLKNIEMLHEAMGSPMDDPKRVVVHIAGTNGKGSVALKIAKSIELSNPHLKVGLFNSPHVSSFRERMQVNGELISEQEVVDLLPGMYKLCVEHDIPATFFGKSAAELSSSDSVVTAITLTISLYPYYYIVNPLVTWAFYRQKKLQRRWHFNISPLARRMLWSWKQGWVVDSMQPML
jgi:hypothetical protein